MSTGRSGDSFVLFADYILIIYQCIWKIVEVQELSIE